MSSTFKHRLSRLSVQLSSRLSPLVLAAVIAGIAAGAIHVRAAESHWREDAMYGVFFYLVAALQILLAVAIIGVAPARQRPVMKAAAAVHAALIIMWVQSRTVGPPLGVDAGEAEVARFADLAATGLEFGALVALLIVLRHPVANVNRLVVWVVPLSLMVFTPAVVAAADPHGPLCDAHAEQPYTGPLGPIDGHSLLERNTPAVDLAVDEAGRVLVGKLVNCDGHDVELVGAEVLKASGAFSVSDFSVAPLNGEGNGTLLAKAPSVPPTGDTPTHGLYAVVRPEEAGRIYIHAVTLYLEGNGPPQPFATIFAGDAEEQE